MNASWKTMQWTFGDNVSLCIDRGMTVTNIPFSLGGGIVTMVAQKIVLHKQFFGRFQVQILKEEQNNLTLK